MSLRALATAHLRKIGAQPTSREAVPLGQSLSSVPVGQEQDFDKTGTTGTHGTIGTHGTVSPNNPDAFDERAAISQYDGGLPREIAEGLARLQTMPPPEGFTQRRWDGAASFADTWGARALELGWPPIELFGIHPLAHAANVACRGLAFLPPGSKVVAMGRVSATVINLNGTKQGYYRWQDDRGAKLAWEVQS
jgi:hypothetical protein